MSSTPNDAPLGAEDSELSPSGLPVAFHEQAAQDDAASAGGTPPHPAEDSAEAPPEDEATGTPPQQGGRSDAVEAVLRVIRPVIEELWHTPEGTAHVTVRRNEHLENHGLDGSSLRRLAELLFYQRNQTTPRKEALDRALGLLAAEAQFEGEAHRAYVRVGFSPGRVYLDLCNDEWEAVEIDADGFRIVARPPVKFVRREGMLPLPRPEPAADASALAEIPALLRLPDEQFMSALLVGWLLGTLNPHRVYVLLVLGGFQGSGKSTVATMLRSLVDPHVVPLQTPPRSEENLLVASANSFCLAFDNVSHIKGEMSDALCRLATGAGMRRRKLYTDSDENLIHTSCPVILNGIEQLIDRPDLADRSIIVVLPPISRSNRVQRGTIEREFEAARPRLLGALCAAAAEALRNQHRVQLDELPRMADFALWVKAAEPALPFKVGTFESAYEENLTDYAERAAETDPVASRILPLMRAHGGDEWEGSVSDLLERLISMFGQFNLGREFSTPRALQGALMRAAPLLKYLGVELDQAGKHPETRRTQYVLRKLPSFVGSEPGGNPAPELDADESDWYDPTLW